MGACGQAEACLAGMGGPEAFWGPHTTQKARTPAVSAPRHEGGPRAAPWGLSVLGGFPLLEWFL